MQAWELIEEGRRLLRTHWIEDAHAALGLFDKAYDFAQNEAPPTGNEDDPGRNLHIQSCYWRGAALTRLARWEDAEDQSYRLAETTGDYDVAQYAYGRYFLERGAYWDATARFGAALQINPRNERALRDRIKASRRGGVDDAVVLAESALKLLPESFAIQSELVLSLLSLLNSASVERASSIAIAIFERSGGLRESHMLLARVLAVQGMYSDAMRRCDKAILLDDQYYDALLMHAWLRDRVTEHVEFSTPYVPDLVQFPEFIGSYPRRVPESPFDSAAILEQAEERGNEQKYAEALVLYDSVIAHNPSDLLAQHGRLRSLRLLRKYDEALTAANALVVRFPADSSLRVELGRLYHDRGEYNEALSWFDEARKVGPQEIDVCVARSLSLCSLRRYGEARRSVKLLLAAKPDDFRLLEEDAWISYHEAKLGAAIHAFDRLLRKAENDVEQAKINYGLGYVAFAQGRYIDAQNHFLQAMTEHDVMAYRIAYAWSLARSSDTDALEEAMDICHDITEDNDDPAAHMCLGVVFFKLNYLRDSERHLKRALEINPAQGSHADLGALYAKMGYIDEAEEELRKAIARDPNDVSAHVELGDLLLSARGSSVREAKREFQKAKAVDRASVLAAIGLSECHRIEGNADRAEEELRSAIRQAEGGDRWRLHAALSRLLMRRGDDQQDWRLFNDAYDAACDALKLAPDLAEPRYLAGLARRLMGDHADIPGRRIAYQRSAVGHFRACIRRNADHKEASRELAAIGGQLADRRRSVPGRLLLGLIALVMIGLSVAGGLKRIQLSSELISLFAVVGICGLIIAVIYYDLKRIKGPAGMEIEFNPREPVVAVGPVGRLVVGVDRIDLPPHLASSQPRRQQIATMTKLEEQQVSIDHGHDIRSRKQGLTAKSARAGESHE